MRNLLARKELPVSVISTIASTKSGVFASVAPQEIPLQLEFRGVPENFW